jgi:uncharacterized membrane protein YoaK (UPF0700 family)
MLGRTAATVMLPCFVMGLQNVLLTKLSNAEIRTHMTGIVTGIGIELGELVHWNAGITKRNSQ